MIRPAGPPSDSSPGPPREPAEVPASADDLTGLWMAEALGLDPDTLVSITVEPLGPTVGFLGDVARIHLDLAPGDAAGITLPDGSPVPATVMTKFPPADPGGRQVGAALNVWARELAFYRQIAPASPGVRVPRCHAAAGDPVQGRWVLVLEDLPSEPLDAGAGATRDQVDAAVDALAVFHGRWWQAGDVPGWLPGFHRDGLGGLQGLWLDTRSLFLDRYGHLLPSPTETWLDAFTGELPSWSDRAGTEPLTIVHADYRLDNLRYHRGRVTMLDWQTALVGPGAMDLTSADRDRPDGGRPPGLGA